MQSISSSLEEIYDRIINASKKSGRSENSIKLLAVSKNFPVSCIQEAVDAGQVLFGESKLQEAEAKIHELSSHLEWHFIGNLQRNKVRKILPLFSTIHSISSKKLALYTNNVAADLGLRPKVFFEVNIGEEETKHGFLKGDLYKDFAELLRLENLDIQGLMAIPPAGEKDQVRANFSELREFQCELAAEFSISLPELSMGMSGDFEMAIEEGATIVRVGSAIFGNRIYER